MSAAPDAPDTAGSPDTIDTADSKLLTSRVRAAYTEEVDRTHRSLIAAAASFAVTFGLLRGLTYAIREGWLPWGNVLAGDVHIHHYVWGVALLLLLGLLNLILDDPRHNPWLAIGYGIASALVIDEYALLLNLRDVYWAEEGRISVDIALATIALSTIYVAGASFWRRVGREVGKSVHPSPPEKR